MYFVIDALHSINRCIYLKMRERERVDGNEVFMEMQLHRKTVCNFALIPCSQNTKSVQRRTTVFKSKIISFYLKQD